MLKKLKRNCLTIILILFTFCLVIFSNSNLSAVKNGLDLWIKSVIPALFPFLVATELLSHTNLISFLDKFLNKFMKPIFNVPGEGSFALLMGIISGYPVGAKIVTNFREQGICTKEEAERLLTFTNNSGPLFILGTVGISLFGDTTTGIVLFVTHLLSCLTVGVIFRFWKCKNNISMGGHKARPSNKNMQNSTIQISNLGEVLSFSIHNAIITITQIGGFVILFSVIISVMKNSNLLNTLSITLNPLFYVLHIPEGFSSAFISGIIELTNGIKIISGIPCKEISINIILTAFLLGFGGFSVLLQVWGIISKTDISIFPYFIAKIIQGLFAALYTYIILNNFLFLNLNL